MKVFSSSQTYEYALRRKLALGLLRWEKSLGTEKQLRAPSVGDLTTRDEFEGAPSRLIWSMFDKHHAMIWRRLFLSDPDRYWIAKAKQEELSQTAKWESGALMSKAERDARNRSSDMPLQPPVII